MGTWLLSFVIGSILQLPPEGLPVAPFDIAIGHQMVPLREALVARAPGVRLVLFVREGTPAMFENANPTGSVTAHLTASDGRELTLEHTGYYYYRGFSGLVLTDAGQAGRSESFGQLELDAKVALKGVRVVWLDRLARTVQDVRPVL